ncbi:MAG TPA: glycosyltransferase [Pseudoxanthomonas sp.]|nr:glycosyltransferase [Pseudoxanthomonas sp.]
MIVDYCSDGLHNRRTSSGYPASPSTRPANVRVNLVAADNGAGLTRDMNLLAGVLVEAGMDVTVTALRHGKLRKWFRPWFVRTGNALRRLLGLKPPFRLNLMQEHIRAEYLPWAEVNVLVPNPEYLLQSDIDLLQRTDCVFVKTRHAEEILSRLGGRTEYIGFTSEDRGDAQAPRARAFLHVAGKSGNKGTQAVLDAWRQHPHWPQLTVVQRSKPLPRSEPVPANVTLLTRYLADDALRELQNSHRFHLCPSRTEGFGHYLLEALGVGAVTLTTDGAPMNELVTPERGILIPVARTGRQAAATTWLVDAAGIADAVERALALDEEQCEKLSEAARKFFLENDRKFHDRIVSVVNAWLEDVPNSPAQPAPGERLAELRIQ